MTFLPIVDRELRVASRNKLTYRGRVITAVVAIFFVGWMVFAFNRMGFRAIGGGSLFGSMSHFVFLFCLFGGLGSTADCLSVEKREGTLGFLFLTDLKGYDIVLGKLLAATLAAFYGLLAAMPALAIPLLLGGVQAGEFWRVSLALLNTLFFSASAGLLISTLSTNGRKFMGQFAGLIWVFFFIVPNLMKGFNRFDWLGKLVEILQWFNPGFALSLAYTTHTGLRSYLFWNSLLVNHLIGWSFLGLASFFLPRVWQDKPAGPKTWPYRERWRQWTLGPADQRKAFRSRALDLNPFFWLAGRGRWRPFGVWFGMALIGIAWGALGWYFGRNGGGAGFVIGAAATIYFTLKISFSAEAARSLAENRQSGALELLVSTPLSVAEIVRGQWLELRRLFLCPVLLVLLLDIAVMMAGNLMPGLGMRNSSWDKEVWTSAWLAGMGMFVADLITLGWVGMWVGLSAKQSPTGPRGSGWHLAGILVLPWVLWGSLLAFLNEIIGIHPGLFFGVASWFVIGVVIDLIFIWWARRKLHRDFRLVATERFQPPKERRLWWPLRWMKRASPAPAIQSP